MLPLSFRANAEADHMLIIATINIKIIRNKLREQNKVNTKKIKTRENKSEIYTKHRTNNMERSK